MSKEKEEEALLSAIILWAILSIFVIVFSLGIFVSFTKKNEKQEMNTTKYETSESKLKYKVITLKDGRKIECVNYHENNDSSISCNWNNPVNQKTTQLNQQ